MIEKNGSDIQQFHEDLLEHAPDRATDTEETQYGTRYVVGEPLSSALVRSVDDPYRRVISMTCHSVSNRMMEELDHFVLAEDVPKHGLHAGDLGTIVMVHDPDSQEDYTGPKGYTAEFTYLTGETRAVVDLRPDQVRPAEKGEVAHATKVA